MHTPTPPIPLWQVLKDEYESFHGVPLGVYVRNVAVLAEALRNPQTPLSTYIAGRLTPAMSEALAAWGGSEPLPGELRDSLLELFDTLQSDADLTRHADAQRVGLALAGAGVSRTLDELERSPLQGGEVYGVNGRLLEAAYPGLTERPDWNDGAATDEERLRRMYAAIRQRRHSALCLSGGGIRSATFNLGLLQGLARHGLLEKFDYLSTVSGGGFIGGWLSAWVKREGVASVVRQLSDPPASPIEPDPRPLQHLRAYGNYLSPKVGLLSADTWTMVATVLRNILLNWLVFVPVIAAALMLPRFWMRYVLRSSELGLSGPGALILGAVSVAVALVYIGLNLPSSMPDGAREGYRRFVAALGRFKWFWWLCLLPVILSSMAFTIYWARLAGRPGGAAAVRDFGWGEFVLFFVLAALLPWIITAIVRIALAKKKGEALLQAVGATLLIGLAQLVSSSIVWYVATHVPAFSTSLAAGLENPEASHAPFLYACFAVPLFLLFQMLAGTLIAGFTSRFTSYDDQEWWSRIGAWTLILIFGWVVVFMLVIYGPAMVLAVTTALANSGLRVWEWSWKEIAGLLGTLAGVVSGAVTLFGGTSAKTPANEEEAKQAGGGSLVLHSLTSLLAPLFLAFLVILLSLATNLLLGLDLDFMRRLGSYNPAALPAGPTDRYWFLMREVSFWLLLVVFLVVFVTGLVMGRLINTNRFSLHYFWRNRIVRAYMGASNPNRRPNPFTGLDPKDNLQMHELRQPAGGTKLLHVLNLALNLVGGSRLAWQERKAESFTVSPLHCGSLWPELGYRPSREYGGADGISLGTAVAISGAFASPNMGYMMTSPVVRFLMTLFNVRFGWWLGNPGPAGDRPNWLDKWLPDWLKTGKTYDLDSPRNSILPIVKEAFGMTGDRSSYVYLSDGGHFENFGLYEMVLRRCRFIVVGDASTDPEYAFSSLGQSIRQIRVDLGVPIEFDDFSIAGPGLQETGKYCAVGRIRYSCADGGDPEAADGTLVYIKPSLLGTEPRDVLNYAGEHAAFPQEFIGDQWFTESQFESYRVLSSHIVEELCVHVPAGGQTFEKFEWSVREHIRSMGLDTLDSQINDLLMREEIKSHLLSVSAPQTPPKLSYLQEKIRKHVKGRFD